MGVRGEVIINDELCKGCELCAHFCPRGCISMNGNRVSSRGFVRPFFVEPDKCNACGICGWLCPDLAIEVSKITTEESPA